MNAIPVSSDEDLANYVLSAMNQTINPCDDFYDYSCGTWISTFVLPPSDSSYPRNIGQISANNNEILISICENPSNGKVYTFNSACINTDAINQLGNEPLLPFLQLVDEIIDLNTLMFYVGQLHSYNMQPYFQFYVDLDAEHPEYNIGQLSQGGTGLPSSALYLGNSTDLIAIYEKHIATVLELAGESSSQAKTDASYVIAIETQLAEYQLPPDEMEDPFALYNKLDLSGLQEIAPELPWQEYLNGMGYPNATELNILVPSFFTNMSSYISNLPLEQNQAYLRWHIVNSGSPYLSSNFTAADFDFYGRVLGGLTEPPARDSICAKETDMALGDQTGAIFAEIAFGRESKIQAEQMIRSIENQMKIDLLTVDWMDRETRARALAKLKLIKNQVGYPEDPDTYSTLTISATNYFSNVMNSRKYSFDKSASGIGQLADKNQWQMTADTVNAYYDPTRNEMVFPAGILQFPYFNISLPMSMNYGGAGVIMGHENTHGFDNEGKDYNGFGKLVDWWQEETEVKFESKVQCVVNQYDQFEVLPGLYVNGKLTENENIADIGGVKNSFEAYSNLIRDDANSPSIVPGLSNIQLFFVSYAQGWCEVATTQYLQNQVATDVHSPAKYRVIGPLQDLPQFGEIWNCPVGSYMNPETKCEVW